MKETILKQRELLNKLNEELDEIKAFLVGLSKEEVCETTKEECLMDTIYNNSNSIDKAIGNTNSIKEIIIGGK